MDKLRNKRCFIFDMDGTIYLGGTLIQGADVLINYLKDRGTKFLFYTNNSSKSSRIYRERLRSLGLEVSEEAVFTSGTATRHYIRSKNQGERIYLLGNEYLKEEFLKDGFVLVEGSQAEPDYVVLGFDTTLTYDKIWKASDHIKEGAQFLATHPDYVCPLGGGKTMPDTGSMIKMFEASTGKTPEVIGKPNKLVIDLILDKYGFQKEELVIIGDRLYTDIKLGENAGIDSVLVLSGETTAEDLKNSQVKPTYVVESVGQLYGLLAGV